MYTEAVMSQEMLLRVSQGWLLRSCSSRSHLWNAEEVAVGLLCNPWHSQAGTSAPVAPPQVPGKRGRMCLCWMLWVREAKSNSSGQPGLSQGTLLQSKHWLLRGDCGQTSAQAMREPHSLVGKHWPPTTCSHVAAGASLPPGWHKGQ